MKRSLSFRVFLPATMLVTLVASIVAWRTVQTRGLGRPIEVVALTAADPTGDVTHTAAQGQAKSARQSLHGLAQPADSAEPPPALSEPPVRRLEGTAFIAKIERTTKLSHHQRTRLTNTLELAATVQKGIDTTDDPDARMDLQRRLDDQVRTRLRMILSEETLALLDEVHMSNDPVAFQFGGAQPDAP